MLHRGLRSLHPYLFCRLRWPAKASASWSCIGLLSSPLISGDGCVPCRGFRVPLSVIKPSANIASICCASSSVTPAFSICSCSRAFTLTAVSSSYSSSINCRAAPGNLQRCCPGHQSQYHHSLSSNLHQRFCLLQPKCPHPRVFVVSAPPTSEPPHQSSSFMEPTGPALPESLQWTSTRASGSCVVRVHVHTRAFKVSATSCLSLPEPPSAPVAPFQQCKQSSSELGGPGSV